MVDVGQVRSGGVVVVEKSVDLKNYALIVAAVFVGVAYYNSQTSNQYIFVFAGFAFGSWWAYKWWREQFAKKDVYDFLPAVRDKENKINSDFNFLDEKKLEFAPVGEDILLSDGGTTLRLRGDQVVGRRKLSLADAVREFNESDIETEILRSSALTRGARRLADKGLDLEE